MSFDEGNVAISFYIQEIENDTENNFNIDEIMMKINNTEINNTEINNNSYIQQALNYNKKYKLKELLLICQYYGFANHLKNNKYNKEQIIQFLISFEHDSNNSDIVYKRQNMWFYINELKNDKFMNKFVLW